MDTSLQSCGQCFDVLSKRGVKAITADTRHFTVTESFYVDSQYYDKFADLVERKPPPPVDKKCEEGIVVEHKEEPRFVVEQQITPEFRQELMKELAEIEREDQTKVLLPKASRERDS